MRRWVRLGTLFVLSFVLSFMAIRVEAAASWCEEDPIIHFANGKKINVAVAVPSDKLKHLRGPVQITITLPKGHPVVRVEPLYAGYFTEDVTVIVDETKTWHGHRNNDIWIDVYVPARGSFPVRANAWGDSVKPRLIDGSSNNAFKFKQTVAP
jgi:hypothetical protein